MSDALADLNDEQREAALARGSCLASACPGSGKTRMLAAKAAHLLGAGETLLAVTFTREAALEIRARIAAVAPKEARPRLLVGTFHSLCFLQPRPVPGRSGFGAAIFGAMSTAAACDHPRAQIATEGDRAAYLSRAIDLAGLSGIEPEHALKLVEAAKAGLEPPPAHAAQAKRLLAAYEDVLRRNAKIDFQDLVLAAVRGMREGSLKPYPVTHMLVDEFQDTDALQYEWIALHAKAGTYVTAVGDDDQSIYGFRAAMGHAGMERFARETNAQRIVLGMNFRSNAEILACADRLIRHNIGRLPKHLRAARGVGGTVRLLQLEDSEREGAAAADWCAAQRSGGVTGIAVLARTNRRLDWAEAALAVRGVPYVRTGSRSLFDRPEVSVFADIMSLAAGAGAAGLDHALTWARVPEHDLQLLHRAIGERLVGARRAELEALPIERPSLEAWWDFGRRLEAWRTVARRGKDVLAIAGIAAWMRERAASDRQAATIGLAEAVFGSIAAPLGRRAAELKNRRRARAGEQGAVVLATMHGAKGLEWERVWIVAVEEKVIPDEKSALEEERRLLYVAMTRAKIELVLSGSARAPVSRFVWEAGLERKYPEARAA
ncbi:MAG TPA: ATP-dependent helicase [Burkholderiales bacterium]|nr:ATP-dependent helicase [Burkholderiales bacterium]